MDPKSPLIIPMPMKTVDMQTGEVVKEGTANWQLMPLNTPNGECPECGKIHDATQPHNAQSLFYQYSFYGKHGRWPTWADAIAHCDADTQALWKAALKGMNAWTEPETAGPAEGTAE
jgi:hypothetical protein